MAGQPATGTSQSSLVLLGMQCWALHQWKHPIKKTLHPLSAVPFMILNSKTYMRDTKVSLGADKWSLNTIYEPRTGINIEDYIKRCHIYIKAKPLCPVRSYSTMSLQKSKAESRHRHLWVEWQNLFLTEVKSLIDITVTALLFIIFNMAGSLDEVFTGNNLPVNNKEFSTLVTQRGFIHTVSSPFIHSLLDTLCAMLGPLKCAQKVKKVSIPLHTIAQNAALCPVYAPGTKLASPAKILYAC